MKRILKLMMLMFIATLSVTLTACRDDDEPADPSIPESGTWKISEYEDLAMRTNSGQVSEYWTFWENEFKKEINGRKIVITKKTPKEDDWYILSKDDERDNIGYLHDLEKIEPISVEGKTMTANYYLKQYISVQDDDAYIIFRATLKLTRK